ncbi:PspC domain-containing protein [Tsukamurella ocularis]|uniref:PspC domain-containing protein n=1 Tax=Tsukamurella ocularis TaxID=1970234 RepID=UPI002167C717|nr:PspC domain-containing protein [Tsukamurella ocularis]MCS3778429.1 signal transduction histidine kinase/phage shock protein PspC (stress-responsive transcriptional regulator) [Tsukamurella ocularis]MCS3789130.1 signal transduction histidine kinase/phage shock protein PspC (stress-responsive transcriptional regulator) [Tsukamurella ocularis]MCS3852981.1 signal transduction histidine kinase/phage shock protein PspC (stress-responsive transcriptional regulator) [Tsukamurella ocularis]
MSRRAQRRWARHQARQQAWQQGWQNWQQGANQAPAAGFRAPAPSGRAPSGIVPSAAARPAVVPPPVQPAPAPSYPRLYRRNGGAVIGGVCGGIADHLGVDATKVRIAFTLLALLGAGVVMYALLWFMCRPGTDTEHPDPAERRQGLALAVLGVVGAATLASVASNTSAGFVVPVLVIGIGAALVWREADSASRTPVSTHAGGSRLITGLRMLGGVTLVIVGLAVVFLGRVDVAAIPTALAAVVLTLVGVALLTVPIWVRMWRDLGAERAARVRTIEREEIASHLHDSVLQTLALIQKQSADGAAVKRLARSQERELREWLFGGSEAPAQSLAAALKAAAADVEDAHSVAVDVITVGDVEGAELGVDDRFTALLGAAKEAMVNAAKHSGCESIDTYAEVDEASVSVFVRDRGVGFDLDGVPSDRQGLAKSIRSRMERRGGSVAVRTAPGRGTEVRLSMARLAEGDETVAAETAEESA